MVKKMRKGITPVIAIVLLLMMTIVVFLGAFVWFKGVQEEFQTGIGEEATRTIQSTQSRLSIVVIWAEDEGDPIKFELKNVGSYTYTGNNLDNFGYYKDGPPVSPSTLCSGMVGPGTTCTVTLDETMPTTAGYNFTLKVVDNFGNPVTQNCKVDSDKTGCE